MDQDRQTPETFYPRPDMQLNGSPMPHIPIKQEEPANGLAQAAKVLGIISIISFFTFTIYPPVILGSLSIILALLSRGASSKMHKKAKNAIITSSIAIGCDVALIAACFFLVFGSPHYFESIYGMSFDELMESIENGTLDYDEFYENIYNNMYENSDGNMPEVSPDTAPDSQNNMMEELPEDTPDNLRRIFEDLQ